MQKIIRSPYFWLGVVIKFPLLWMAGSHYLNDLFIPFLDSAIKAPGENPWNLMHPSNFPYGSVLFFILYIPKFILHLIFGESALGSQPLSFFSVKSVLLLADFLLLFVLHRIVPQRTRELLWFYWLNPVLIYISYVHGQLDVVPMLFAISAIYLASQKKVQVSAVLTAVAVLSKFHTVIVVPVILSFYWNNEFWRPGLRKIGIWLGIFLAIFSVGYFPFVAKQADCYSTLCSPEAMRIFGAQLNLGDSHILYIGLAIFMAALVRVCLSTRLTAEALIYGSGFLFGVLLLVVNPMPGWYYWVFPFFALFYSTYSLAFRSLFFGSCVLYFLYFSPLTWVAEPLRGLASGILLTTLQLSILGILLSLWTFILRQKAPWTRRTRPLLVGVAGNSGAGKNTFSQALVNLFGKHSTTVVEGDDYHRWERGHFRWQDYTHLNPRANNLEDLAQHTSKLMSGGLIFQPHYDHSMGQFTAPRLIKSSRTIVVQGLHSLYLKQLRDQYDLSVFISPDERLRAAWKLLRDVKERGHKAEQVLKNIEMREQDSKDHIDPQKAKADLVIEYIPKKDFDPKSVLQGETPEYFVRYTLWNDSQLEALLNALAKVPSLKVSVEILPTDIDRVCVDIEGLLTVEHLEQVSKMAFGSLRHLTRSREEPQWKDGVDGLSQLMTLVLLQRV